MERELTEVFDDHVWDVYAFLAYRLGSAADAEDLTQATFERAVRAWSRFDPRRASERTWLMAIARNLLIDFYREGAVRPRTTTGDDATFERATDPLDGPEQRLGPSPELMDALATLSEREHELLALRFGGDLTGPEIAAELDLTLANVQQILSRALRKLRAQLEPSGGEGTYAGEAGSGDRQ